MDWSKAKTILIVLFIVLNVFLGVLSVNYFFGGDTSRENIKSTINILEQRGYTLKCNIPNTNDGYRLNYENGDFAKTQIINKLLGNADINPAPKVGEELSSGNKRLVFESRDIFAYNNEKPDERIDISSINSIDEYLKGFLEEMKLPVTGFLLDSYKRNQDGSVTLNYLEEYKGYMIFDNYAEIQVSDMGIKHIKCKFVKVSGLTKIKNLIPAYQVLLKRFTQGGGTIKEIQLGYLCENSTTVTSGGKNPIWRIRMENGETRYFENEDGIEKKVT